MYLSFTILNNVYGVNFFSEVDDYEIIRGNPGVLYFRIISLDSGSRLRYVPAAGATVSVKFLHIDSNKAIERTAQIPFPSDDRSILSVPIMATDTIQSDSMSVTLTEAGKTLILRPLTALRVSVVDGAGKFYC